MSNYLSGMTKWLGYSLVVVIVFMATAVSVGRLIAPYLNENKHDFEVLAAQLLNSPVKIEHIAIAWNGYIPQISLDDVTVLDKIDQKPIFNIHHVKLNIKILDSILHWQPVLSYIKISGMELNVRSKNPREFTIEGFGDVTLSDDFFGGMHEANEVVAWVFSQPALAVSDIHLNFYTETGVKKSITLDDISLVNRGQKHLLSGKGILHQPIETAVEIALDWRGDVLDIANSKANLYLYLEGVSLSQWLKEYAWQQLKITEGLGSAKIWVTWERGIFQEIQTQMQLYQLNIYSEKTNQTQLISRLNGHFGWKRKGDYQVIAGDEILMDLPEHLWPTTQFALTVPLLQDEWATKDWHLHVGYFDISDVLSIATRLGFLDEALKKTTATYAPKGEILNLYFDRNDPVTLENNTLRLQVKNLTWAQHEEYPGLQNLSGGLSWDGKEGTIDLATERTQLFYPNFFYEPLYLDKISGSIYFKKNQADVWSVQAKNFAINNDDLEINSNFAAEIIKNESPWVDLQSTLTVKRAENLKKYFPLKKSEPEFKQWMLQAFRGGQFISGKVILQGKLKDYPFTQNNGKFNLSAFAENVTFGFALHWPEMKNVYGNIVFNGPTMSVDIASGDLMGLAVKNVTATIPDISPNIPQTLTVQGKLEGDLNQAWLVIQQSPLKDKIAKDVQNIQLNGDLKLDLNLNIPLKKPEQTKSVGLLTLDDATFAMPTWNFVLNKTSGTIQFSDQSLASDDLQGILWQQPVTIRMSTLQPGAWVTTEMIGQVSDQVLKPLLHDATWATLAKGQINYHAKMRFSMKDNEAPMVLTIETDLQGLALNLPIGLGKTANEMLPSKITAKLKPKQPLAIQWVYGTKLNAATIIKTTETGLALYSAEVRLGVKEKANFQTQPGVVIAGQFDVFDWAVWQKRFAEWKPKNTQQKESFTVPNFLRAIDVKANKITGIFQTLTDAHIVLSKSANDFSFNIDSHEIAGEIKLPIHTSKEAITANFSRLYLQTQPGKIAEAIDPNILPALSFDAMDVKFNDKNVGHVYVAITPRQNGVNINRIHVGSEYFTLDAGGLWTLKDKKAETQLEGKLTTKNVAAFLSYWGSPTENPRGSGAIVNFNLRWPDAPYKPVLANLSGALDMTLSPGQIVNLDTSTSAKMGLGRILNLLSLETISRTLTLNFSELTDNGYSFNSMKGDFNLKNGNAYTEGAYLDGSLAHIEMSGRLGLAAKDYDISVTVTPHITGSIPVVAAIAVNPIAGIAAWAVEKIAGKAVSNATTRQYRITGTWEKPEWGER